MSHLTTSFPFTLSLLFCLSCLPSFALSIFGYHVFAAHSLRWFDYLPPSMSPLPPADVADFSQAAGNCAETYCRDAAPGLVVGDSTLLWVLEEDSNDDIQGVQISCSQRFGVVLAYQGTNMTSFPSIMNDVKFRLVKPAPLYDEILPEHAKVHEGFQNAFKKTVKYVRPTVLQALERCNKADGTKGLLVTGHSQGSALAVLGGLWWRQALLHLTYIPVRVIGFGQVRVGNRAFADAVDKLFPPVATYAPFKTPLAPLPALSSQPYSLAWIVNGRDPVPHMPFRDLGYEHTSGQVFINPSNMSSYARRIPGHENPNGSEQVPPNRWYFGDHGGVYFGTSIAGSLGKCPATVGNAVPQAAQPGENFRRTLSFFKKMIKLVI